MFLVYNSVRLVTRPCMYRVLLNPTKFTKGCCGTVARGRTQYFHRIDRMAGTELKACYHGTGGAVGTFGGGEGLIKQGLDRDSMFCSSQG